MTGVDSSSTAVETADLGVPSTTAAVGVELALIHASARVYTFGMAAAEYE